MLAVGRVVYGYLIWGCTVCVSTPSIWQPEGYELIKEEHNRRGKTEGRNQIKGRGGLAREAKYFRLFLEFSLNIWEERGQDKVGAVSGE